MRRLLVPALAAVLGAALIGLLAFGLTQRATSRTLDDSVAHGERPAVPAATRQLPLLAGSGASSIAAYRGRVVVLNFWASWCEPCKAEAPLLARAQRQLAQSRATVLGVTYADTTSDSLSFARRYGLSYPMLRDVDGSFAHAFGTNQLPESFVIDRAGRVAAISRGEVSQGFLDRAVTLAEAS